MFFIMFLWRLIVVIYVLTEWSMFPYSAKSRDAKQVDKGKVLFYFSIFHLQVIYVESNPLKYFEEINLDMY